MRSQENPVMARKVRGPKMRLSGFPVMEPLCNAFAAICATRMRKDLRTGVDVEIRGYEAVRHGAYLQALAPNSAIHTLAFSQNGGAGLVRAEHRLLDAIITQSLRSANEPMMAVDDRALTPIDITIYRRFVGLLAQAFDDAIIEVCGRSAIGRGQPDRFERDPGMVRIAADRAELFTIHMSIQIADQAESTELDFAVSVSTLAPLKEDLLRSATLDTDMVAQWERSMRDQVTDMELGSQCVIDLGDFSVGELSRLEQGALIELPPDAMNAIELRVPTTGGDVTMARGRLGANGRHKAVRLVDDPSAEFLAPLRALLEDATP